MRKLNKQVRLHLFLDAFLFCFCIIGIIHLSQKADLPFHVINDNGRFLAGAELPFNNIQIGDTLLSFDGIHFTEREGLEIYLDSKSIGDKVSVTFSRSGVHNTADVFLIRYYTLPFIFSNSLAGLLFIVFGVFVLLQCPELKAAKIFHWGSVGIAIMLLNTWGKYTMNPLALNIAARTVYHLSYVLTPTAFLHFSLTFPTNREPQSKFIIKGFYIAGLVIALVNLYAFIRLLPQPGEQDIKDYLSAYFLNRTLAIINILAAISVFFYSYLKTENSVEKKKLKWLISGFLIGPLSFVVLWALPQVFSSRTLMPEIFIPLLMLFIPITFTIAIVRYHLMDIDLLIRRSIIYSIVIFLLVIIYIAVIAIVSSQLLLLNDQTPSVIAAIMVALLFQPIRKKIQLFVDKKFFRVQYDFREALKKFIRDISEINSVNLLAERVVKESQEFIPVKKSGFFLLNNDHVKLIAHRNFDLLVGRSLAFDKTNLKSDLSLPIADPARIEPGVVFEIADLETFKRWGMDLVIPIKSGDGTAFGFLVLGEKKSGTRFSMEDIDLLNNVVANIASTLSRIYLQEQLIRKNLEAEKLEDLNKQKTMFVSTVSHELKTPLASIKVFSEMLKNDRQASEKQKDYLNIIEGETDRLTRLINNVLGYAWIERGTRQYNFESISVNMVVEKTLTALNYQLKMEGFKVEKKLSTMNWMISCDKDAAMEALINVITNAIKFSLSKKEITVSTYRLENFSCIEVRDKGIGIKPEDIRNLFKPFFRSQIAANMKISGTGLGLSIIKHVMDAHKGKIDVQSVPEEGTAFILKFPIEVYDSSYLEKQSIISISLKKQEEAE